jgi:hypothetical protein
MICRQPRPGRSPRCGRRPGGTLDRRSGRRHAGRARDAQPLRRHDAERHPRLHPGRPRREHPPSGAKPGSKGARRAVRPVRRLCRKTEAARKTLGGACPVPPGGATSENRPARPTPVLRANSQQPGARSTRRLHPRKLASLGDACRPPGHSCFQPNSATSDAERQTDHSAKQRAAGRVASSRWALACATEAKPDSRALRPIWPSAQPSLVRRPIRWFGSI